MNKKILLLLSFILFITSSLPASSLFTSDEKRPIAVHNRILAKVNGNAITVMDVMKKMDMLFYHQFPEYISSSPARLQFYGANWEAVLQDLIDKELIIADAEECKLQISNGDIRQEMENLFGPNIIANLDKVGLTYNEAWKMVRNDIIMKRMLYIKAHSKALKQITPEVTLKAYEEYAQAHLRPTIWVYQVISVRDKNGKKAEKISQEAYTLLQDKKISIADLSKNIGPLEDSTKLTISEEFRHAEKEVSASYKEPLSRLSPRSFSQPISLKSRTDNSIVYRIFYLHEKIPGGKIPFSEIGAQIRDNLLNESALVETENYLLKLRKHFDLESVRIEDLKAEGFEPFKLS